MSTTTLRRRRTSISIQPQLMTVLRERANRTNTSLSSYIESILLDAIYSEPNEETVAAIMALKFQNIVVEILIDNHEKVKVPFFSFP